MPFDNSLVEELSVEIARVFDIEDLEKITLKATGKGLFETWVGRGNSVQQTAFELLEEIRKEEQYPPKILAEMLDRRPSATNLIYLIDRACPEARLHFPEFELDDGGKSTDRNKGIGQGEPKTPNKGVVVVLIGSLLILGIFAHELWQRTGTLNVEFLDSARSRTSVMPGQQLTVDLSVVVSRGKRSVKLEPSYVINKASNSCGLNAPLGSWSLSISEKTLTAIVPHRLKNLLEPCSVSVEAVVTDDEETATVDATFVFSPKERKLIAVEAGAQFGCVLEISGEVTCWGGIGDSYGDITAPKGLKARSIAAGTYAVCAILHGTKNVQCWGDSLVTTGRGEIQPSDQAAIGPVAGIAGGNRMFCATLIDENVDCWNSFGTQRIAFPVNDLNSVRTLFGDRVCGMGDGNLICAAINLPSPGPSGEVVLNDAPTAFWRVTAQRDEKIVDFSDPAMDHVCVLYEDRKIYCYLFSTRAEIDISNKFPSNVQKIIDTGQSICALGDTGEISCSRIEALDPLPMTSLVEVEDFSAVAITAADHYGLCAISVHDKVKCWSNGDSSGQSEFFVTKLPDSLRAEP